MALGTRVVWASDFTRYDFGPSHPMTPVRLELTAALCRQLGLFDLEQVELAGAEVASDDTLAVLHDRDYIAAVKAASLDPENADTSRGLGTEDDPAFVGIHEASARIVQASLECAEAVWSGQVQHAVNFCGGMHHAMAGRASGFCVYNDAALAIHRLLELGAKRVVYVDVDVHHGDGTESFFVDDPRVMTISVHETGRLLFPGSGFADDMGGPNAIGDTVNLPLPPWVSGGEWLRSIQAVVPALVRAFDPDVLVTQHGCDTHKLDPLAHLSVSVDAQRLAAEMLHDLAHEVCGGRWLATGGGGYEIIDVVPRSWTHLVAIAAHAPLDPSTAVPQAWLDEVQQRFGRQAPATMSDGDACEYETWGSHDPESMVDRAVMVTRKAIFPLHGLDPWFD